MSASNLQFPFKTLMQLPGHRSFRRLLQSIIRQLAQVAVSNTSVMSEQAKVALFRLIPEYSVAAMEAASFAASKDVVVSLPDDTIVIPRRLLMMLYLDYLVFGVATFELAKDVVTYADPRQFSRIAINQLGEPELELGSRQIADRVGVIARCPNPFAFGWSVPEIIPHSFLYFLSLHSRMLYDLSPFKKPNFLIVTNEMVSDDELLARRRKLIDQLEEDYGTVLMYANTGEDRLQVVELRSEDNTNAEKFYEEQVALLRATCGVPGRDGNSIPYPIAQFYASLESELQRLCDDQVSISFSTEEGIHAALQVIKR